MSHTALGYFYIRCADADLFRTYRLVHRETCLSPVAAYDMILAQSLMSPCHSPSERALPRAQSILHMQEGIML